MAPRSHPPVPRRSARSKPRQTTLQFSPLPSSSPAKEGYSQAVQERLASVRYLGAKGKSRDEINDALGKETMLLTPEPSSQVQIKDEDEEKVNEVEPADVPDSMERGFDGEDDDDLVSPAQKRRKVADGTPFSTRKSPPQRRSTRLRSHPTSDSAAAARQIDTPATLMQSSPLTRRSTRLQRAQPSSPPARFSRSPSIQTLVSVDIPTPPRLTSSRLSNLASAETTDEDDNILASRPLARRGQSKAVKDPSVSIPYSFEDGLLKRRTPSRKPYKDFVVDDDEVEYITSDEEIRTTQKGRGASGRKANARAAARRRTREEQDELDDDLRDLQDSDQEPSATTQRTRGGPVTTKRDQAKEHFELLRRRRRGEKVPRVQDSEDESDEFDGVNLDLIGHPDHSEEGSVHSSIDTDAEQDPLQEDDEDDFVVEDSAERLGRPSSDMPLQFTAFASAKPRELFIHIIEWLVKNRIAPAFSREDELYNLAFARVDDQVKAQAGSRLISTAWGNEFTRAILARPDMKVAVLPGADEDNLRICDACNRVNHPARYEFVFSGEPYVKKSLEPVDNSDDDDDSEADNISRDENGNALPSQHRRFYLGRYCAANAEMGHKLTHWKYHLNDNLLAYLEEQGVLSTEAILAREKANKKKREKEAENIVDSMQETGMIADLWADFENNLNDARLGMEDFEKRGGRSKGRIGAIRSKVNGTIREWNNDRVRETRAPASDSDED